MPEAMSQVIVNCGLFGVLIAIGIVLARGRVQWSWIMIALGVFILQDGALTLGWNYLDFLSVIDSPWNWEGRILLVVLVLVMSGMFFPGPDNSIGLRINSDGGAPIRASLLTLVLIAVLGAAAYSLSPGRMETDLASLVYQASLPSITDEMVYRGILLVALDRAFGRPLTIMGAKMGWGAFMTAMLFAASQTLSATPDYVMSLNVNAAGYFFTSGLILAWIRSASGSVYLPIILHSWANVSVFFI